MAKPRFARFDTPENGIRALGKLLQTYQRVYGLNTVAKIISRWAPSNENDTAAYVRSVERRIGLAPGAKIQLTELLSKHVNVNAFKEQVEVNVTGLADRALSPCSSSRGA